MGNTFDFDMMLSSAREAYGEELYKMACEGLDFVFTYSDNVAPSSSAGKLLREFPERCFNMGIAEPDQVGASAGLALAGCTVFSQVFGPFLPLRAADQIHTDIAYNDVKVRLIGTHAGVTAGGGPTHNDIADLALYRAIPNLTVVAPADAPQCCKFIRQSMDFEGPMIIRIDRAGSPVVYHDDYELVIGKAIETLEGTDAYIISCGTNIYEGLMASKMLKEKYGVSVGVLDMHTIKPLDEELVLKAAKQTGRVYTVEEHSIIGGLGSAVAELLGEKCPTKITRIGVKDVFGESGPAKELLHKYELDAEGIAKRIMEEQKSC